MIMDNAIRLQKLIEGVKGKLQAEGIAFDDYDRAIKCLKECVAPNLCIEIYEKYINY